MSVLTLKEVSSLVEDGINEEAYYSSHVNDLQDVAYFLSEALRRMGYTYVEDVSIKKSDGTYVRSDL